MEITRLKTTNGIKYFLENKNNNDFVLNVFGKEDEIKEKFKKYQIDTNKINLINSNKVVGRWKALTAVKNSKDTVCGTKHQLEGKSDISLSAGNTGVLLVISRMILKMMDELQNSISWPVANQMAWM